MSTPASAAPHAATPQHPGFDGQADISARIERLPMTRKVFWTRNIIGAATFFDGYTVIAIAYAMPVLVKEWGLSPQEIGMILSLGYIGQLVGAIFFGWLAERIGRLHVLLLTILLFVSMDIACLTAWSATSMIVFRFLQGIGTGGEVPVASAYINEYVGARTRGRFFLLYEVMFLLGLVGAGVIGYFLVPVYGWRAMFIVGLVPSVLMIPLRWFLSESPRWLASRGRYAEADRIVSDLERSATAAGHVLEEPRPLALRPAQAGKGDWRELFRGIYLKRTLMIWPLWFATHVVNNGMATWLPTLYRQVFNLPLSTSLAYGFTTSGAGVVGALTCAMFIDRVGRKRWYTYALLLAAVPLGLLGWLGATSATQVLCFAAITYAITQSVTFSLYLYSAELYPTRIRAIATGFGSAWLRLGSSAGPLVVGAVLSGLGGIQWVFVIFSALILLTGAFVGAFAVETKGRVLEELSP